MSHPKVAIIILNWNGKEDTIECLESLKDVTYPNYEILLVDNGSIDGSVECFKDKYPEIDIIENSENLGFAEGNNVGIRRATDKGADYVLMLNNDTVVDPEFLGELVKVTEEDERIGAIGPDIRLYDNPSKPQIKKYGRIHTISDVDTLSGACLLLKIKVLLKIGLLHAIYFCYDEDREINERLKKNGYRVVYVPTNSKVYHKLGSTSNKISNLQIYYMTRNRFLTVRKHKLNIDGILFLIKETFMDFIIQILLKRNVKIIPPFFNGIVDGVTIFITNPSIDKKF